jgi:hypothetical protein
MKFPPGRSKQAELSDNEQIALRGIAAGGPVALALCLRLQKLGLVAKTLDVWGITPQGHIHLTVCRGTGTKSMLSVLLVALPVLPSA